MIGSRIVNKVLVVVGYGPGISDAVARKFGTEGFAVALVSRNRERLDAGVASLRAEGIEAAAFTADAGDPESIARALNEVRTQLGSITVIKWTAYGTGAGDVTTAGADELRAIFDVPVVGLASAVQAALPDLRQSPDAAVLVTNGGLGLFDPAADQMGVEWNAMGLSIANAAKHKLVRMLAHKLKLEGIFVGEVVVLGTIRGTAFDSGNATLDAAEIADEFWKLYVARDRNLVTVA
jgi:NAD(P)-dependent dehydrogenase (short-subunit alcohol dehydrogenase family)